MKVKAKKSFGQNWLRDEYVLDSIIASAVINPTDAILEVGPGLGTLTRKLVDTGADVYAIEADQDLLPALKNKFAGYNNIQIIKGDILKYNFGKLPSGYKVVANIPYYLTSNLIRELLESSNKPSLVVLLIQKEVAQRILAGPGAMSVLSFSVQYYSEPELIMEVSRELFDPVPKVDSALIKLVCLNKPLFEADTQKLFRLVKAGFGEKRKMLRNSLAGGLSITTKQAESLLALSGILPSSRAQELSMAQWQQLYTTIDIKANLKNLL